MANFHAWLFCLYLLIREKLCIKSNALCYHGNKMELTIVLKVVRLLLSMEYHHSYLRYLVICYCNPIRIISLLWFFWCFSDTLTYNIHYGFIYSTDQSGMCLLNLWVSKQSTCKELLSDWWNIFLYGIWLDRQT